MTAHDAHRFVAEAERHAIGLAHQITAVEVDLSVHLRAVERTLHREVAFGITLETDYLVGNETVGQRERKVLQRQSGVEVALSLRIIGTDNGAHLGLVLEENSIHIVGAVSLRDIHKL